MSISYQRPCLRWPGNKYSLLKVIIPLVPKTISNYHEPFVGSGSVFLNTSFEKKAYLSDCNPELINFYEQVKTNLPDFLRRAKKRKNSEEAFYLERDKSYRSKIEKAAQLYYLNRTCFNGIYRINSSGKFNVPYGHRKNLQIVDAANLLLLNKKLSKANLKSCDFFETLDNIQKGDFVYIDPPYRSKIHNGNFLMYNENLFSWDDQLRLMEYCSELKRRKVRFIISNLYNEEIYNLFVKKLNLKSLTGERYSLVGATNDRRGLYKEYIFYYTN